MINFKLHKFVERSYLLLLGRFISSRSCPSRSWITSAFSLGFFITFIPTVDQNSQSTVNLDQATRSKNEFIKYEQREHPGNVQLPTTRRGLHSILNNPASSFGEQLDRTKGNLLFYYSCFTSPLMGMKIREELSNSQKTA